MTTGLYKKGLVLGIICLFIGTGVVSSISGNNNLNGPPEVEWHKTYGETEWDEANYVQQTNDGGYVLAGSTMSLSAGGWYVWLIKTDSSGNKLWDKTYGGTDYDLAYCVQQTNDGGYIITGGTKSYGAGNADFSLVPLAMPSLSGPGAITVTIVGMKTLTLNIPWFYAMLIAIISIIIVMIITFVIFMSSSIIIRVLGKKGMDAFTRVMGLLTVAIAVQFALTGIADWVTTI